MGALIDSGKHLVLNNRYALLGCIAVSGAGKIYRGRDLEQVKYQGLESRILIHVLPHQASQWALDELFQHISSTTQHLALPWILAPLAYGHDNGQAYVVLESPDTWELQSFLTQAGQQSPCHQNASKNLKPLIKKRYLDEHLDPALLLCVAGTNVHVLATALSPQVQQLEKRGTHRVIPRKHIGHALMTGSLLALFGIFTAVAGNAVLETVVSPNEPMQLAALAPLEIANVLPVNREQQVYKDTPIMEVNPLPVNKVESKMVTPPVAAKPTVKRQPLPSQPPATAEPAPAKKATPTAMPEETPTEQIPNTGIASPQADDSIDSLIQQAYAAMDAGHLGHSSNSALHFTRKLRGQSPNHPQVARLGQEMAAATLRQIRVALQAQNLEQTERLLPMSRQLIQEFNLNHLQAAQQVLEDKTLELRTHL
ncbi:hypothetical protein [Thiothrix winogradskyi]|uniref:Uncharacterized protein n=1 Tax=Thiothrix winogradskyi TaxID=96472 RepID=A0ABY3SZR7_9GAMM|nr:hypothetical protein [Thiothrix winogradskyi]UJS25056.1 hypothetical protein L2Y54_03200 [Thiothrix winogradskyi]